MVDFGKSILREELQGKMMIAIGKAQMEFKNIRHNIIQCLNQVGVLLTTINRTIANSQN